MRPLAHPTPSAPTAYSYSRKQNRRRYTRVPTRQMRSCYLARGVGPSDGWVVDISLGGVFLRTPSPLAIGEHLAIELPRVGKTAPVCVRGRVVSSCPLTENAARPGMGVRFDALDPMTLTQLREMIGVLAPAGTKLELQPEDVEITAVAPMPLPSAPMFARPSAPGPTAPMSVRPSAPLPKLTAARPSPIPAARPSIPRRPVHGIADPFEAERLRNHTKGLLMQVGDLTQQLSLKDKEIADLREAVSRLQLSNAQLRSGDY